MTDLYDQILSIECDQLKAGAEYSSPRIAYQEGFAGALIAAADLSGQTRDAATAAIAYALSLRAEGITFLECWVGGNFDLIRKEWPEAPEDVFTEAITLFAPASAA
jgi:hypothetical protein